MIESELYKRIVDSFLDTESVKATAKELGTSVVKVRKVLLTEGLWSSKTSEEIQYYLNAGKTTAEIAVLLSTTEKAVQQYLPYTRGLYNSENPTVSAVNSADYRERIKIAKENALSMVRDNKMYLEESGDMTDLVRLHLELLVDGYDDEASTLRKYGNVSYGDAITRDIIVPGDMPLWSLNYAIQKCFGWQNSHLHCFELPEEQFEKLTNNSFSNYCDLVGVIFRSPWMDQEAEFWQDDYESGSFKTWLRKKYKGPYLEMCYEEGVVQCKNDLEQMEERFEYIEVERCFRTDGYEYFDHLKPISETEYKKRKVQGPIETHENDRWGMRDRVIKEVYEFDDIPMGAARWMSERHNNQLLERLCVKDVLALQDKVSVPECFEDFMNEEIQMCINMEIQPLITPVSDCLYYKYDFGDGWVVKITASSGAEDLVDSGRLTKEELNDAMFTAEDKYTPVCIAQDGYPVLDDVGGMSGYIEFLKGINEEGEAGGLYEDAKESLEWAKSLGWSKRKISNKNLL